MRNRTWITREEIAEIYDHLADQEMDIAANKGGRDDIDHVVEHLNKASALEVRAQLYRDTDKIAQRVGNPVVPIKQLSTSR